MVPSFSIKFIDTIYDLDKTNLVPFAVPDGYDADNLRKIILDDYSMSLGTGLTKLKNKVFRIFK